MEQPEERPGASGGGLNDPPLLPEWCAKGAVVHVVFPSRRGLLLSVRALIDFLAAKFAELPED